MSIVHPGTGTLLAGDALGVRLPGAGLYQALPPPDLDPARGDASLARLAELDATALCVSHFGPVPDPASEIALAREQLATLAEAARAGWAATGTVAGVALAAEEALPMEPAVADPAAVERFRWIGWHDATAAGLAAWAAAQEAAPAA
jgi:glyoxylase-like metal-dependent hydrolase (beta-lactamase superfamily II)